MKDYFRLNFNKSLEPAFFLRPNFLPGSRINFVSFCIWFSEPAHYVAQANLNLMSLLPQPQILERQLE